MEETSAPLEDTAPSESQIDTSSAPLDTTSTTPSPESPPSQEFVRPEEYKDAAWADKVNSPEDLWKQLANSQELIGRKQVVPDFKTATPQEIENYFSQTRPEDTSAYSFSSEEGYENNPLESQLADMLHSNGISAHQGNAMIKAFQDLEAAQIAQMFDKEAFNESLESTFGKKYEERSGEVQQFIEQNMNEDQKARFNHLPNDYKKLMFELASNIDTAYGARESGSGGNSNPGNVGAQDVTAYRADLTKQIFDLDKQPFADPAEKQRLIELRNQTFKG